MKTYKYKSDSIITWTEQTGPQSYTMGLIQEGQTRARQVNKGTIEEPEIVNEEYSPWNELMESGVEIKPIDLDEAKKRDKAEKKARKMIALNNATVEVEGLVFQANELSRSRMLSAIITAETVNETSTTWKMADNTESVITLDQLKQAHAKATRLLGGAVLEGGE